MKNPYFATAMMTSGQRYILNNINPAGRCKSRNRKPMRNGDRTLQKLIRNSAIQYVSGVRNDVFYRVRAAWNETFTFPAVQKVRAQLVLIDSMKNARLRDWLIQSFGRKDYKNVR